MPVTVSAIPGSSKARLEPLRDSSRMLENSIVPVSA